MLISGENLQTKKSGKMRKSWKAKGIIQITYRVATQLKIEDI